MGSTAYERLVVASQAFLDPGWLPPEEDCPELADLREQHERLLAACDEALAELGEATRAVEQARGQRADALRDAFLSGSGPESVTLAEPDESALAEARSVYDAATAALEAFVASAQAQIEERGPQIRDGINGRLREADAKRAEARKLLEEANRLEAEPRRLLNWLDRYTTVTDTFSGEQRKASVLGPIAYETLGLPERLPAPELFHEITGLPPATVVEVGGDEVTDEEREAMQHA